MVLEAIAALSLGANVLQFVSLGTKMYKGFKEIKASGTGTLDSVEKRRELAEDLRRVLKDLELPEDMRIPSRHERAVVLLARSCQDEADRLIAILEKLKLETRHRRWESVKQCFKAVWNEKEIKQFEHKLDEYRSELTLCMVKTMRFVKIASFCEPWIAV